MMASCIEKEVVLRDLQVMSKREECSCASAQQVESVLNSPGQIIETWDSGGSLQGDYHILHSTVTESQYILIIAD